MSANAALVRRRSSKSKSLPLMRYLLAIAADLDVADDEAPPENTTLRMIASELRGLADQKIEVGLFMEGGIVQGARATTPVDVFIVDDDVFEQCAGRLENDGRGPARCARDEDRADREEHAAHRQRFKEYKKLPFGVL